MRNKLICLAAAIAACIALCPVLSAEETLTEELTSSTVVTVSGGADYACLTDSKESTYAYIPAGGSVTLSAEGISSIYVKFHLRPKQWTAVYEGGSSRFGENGFLHEYAVLPEVRDTVDMTFSEEAEICEIRVFGKGSPPDDVQVWQKPYEKADAVLLSSHSDDEQLFFAGMIPYCAAHDIDLQVVYFCYHDDVPIRLHEQLNGMWTAGATHYPVIGRFPDLYSESLAGALSAFSGSGYSREDFVAYQCEIIRRFRPEVVIGHDVDGEYGHGTHRLNTDTLMEALELTADSAAYPESAQEYGTWNVPKTYLHLWNERQIVMDFDEPLEYFGGRSAYQMSVEGYGCHNSQHWTWFTEWLVGTDGAPVTAASQITRYSPCSYGLYRTTVGDDVSGDMFEHVTLRKDTPPETSALPDTEADISASAESTVSALSPADSNDISVPRDNDEKASLGAEAVFLAAAGAVAFFAVAAVIIVRIRDKR